MELIVDLPENLAASLRSNKGNLTRIFEAGLREFNATTSIGYRNLSDVLEFLAGLPSPNEILELRPSEELEIRINEVLEKNRRQGLNDSEEQFWASYEFIEHLVRIAKSAALKKLKK